MSGGKIIVGVDTSSSPLLVVAKNEEEKTASCKKSGVKQEKLLFPAITRALQKVDSTLADVKTVFVVRGPGRFTGIRIALTFASMLKELNGAVVRGATLFEILHLQAAASKAFLTWKKQNPAGALAVVLHAFREEYFLQIFDGENTPPRWLSRADLHAALAQYAAPLFVTGFDKDKTPLTDLLENKYVLADFKDCQPRPATLLAMAAQDKYAQDALEPLYLKPARFELETKK